MRMSKDSKIKTAISNPQKAEGFGWTEIEPGGHSPQPLKPQEIPIFLAWLFSDLAKKPPVMRLKEVAAVARTLLWMSISGVPLDVASGSAKKVERYRASERSNDEADRRTAVERIANAIWADLLRHGDFKPSSVREARSFVLQYAKEASNPAMADVLCFLEDFDLPRGEEHPFERKGLTGQFRAADLKNRYLDHDLSERIAAADYVLQSGGPMEQRRSRIAEALNASPVIPKRKGAALWGDPDVGDCVKSYERRSDHLPQSQLAHLWLSHFRWVTTQRPRRTRQG